MNYVDKTLISLADPTTRLGIFDDMALEQLVSAAYDTNIMNIQGPFQPLFDDFRLGVSIPNLGIVEGAWSTVGGAEKVEVKLNVTGIADGIIARIDAVWSGSIVARTVPTTGLITQVETEWPSPGALDEEIKEALGALPADPQVLEQERRARLITRIKNAHNQPATFTAESFDAWLNQVGATSVGDLLARRQGTVQSGVLKVTFSPPTPVPPSPKPLPLAAALLIRDNGFSVAQLLRESKIVRERLEMVGIERPRDNSLPIRQALIVIWVFPVTVFDDTDWPGGNPGMSADDLRIARRLAAGQWLAREGIGVVATL